MRTFSFLSLTLLGLSSVVSAIPAGDVKPSPTIGFARAPSTEECPETDNGPGREYKATIYQGSQLKAAILASAKLQIKNQQIGAKMYPHTFFNTEKLEFECGKNKVEFPVQVTGDVYDGGDVDFIPDRIVYEYAEGGTSDKPTFTIKFCGLIRHGPKKPFLECTPPK